MRKSEKGKAGKERAAIIEGNKNKSKGQENKVKQNM